MIMTAYKTKGKPKELDFLIGKNLLILRNKAKYSRRDIGDIVGVSYQQIQKYETGNNRIAASTLLELSKVLNVSVNQFYGGTYDPIPKAKGELIDTIVGLRDDEWNKFIMAFEYALRVARMMS